MSRAAILEIVELRADLPFWKRNLNLELCSCQTKLGLYLEPWTKRRLSLTAFLATIDTCQSKWAPLRVTFDLWPLSLKSGPSKIRSNFGSNCKTKILTTKMGCCSRWQTQAAPLTTTKSISKMGTLCVLPSEIETPKTPFSSLIRSSSETRTFSAGGTSVAAITSKRPSRELFTIRWASKVKRLTLLACPNTSLSSLWKRLWENRLVQAQWPRRQVLTV